MFRRKYFFIIFGFKKRNQESFRVIRQQQYYILKFEYLYEMDLKLCCGLFGYKFNMD